MSVDREVKCHVKTSDKVHLYFNWSGSSCSIFIRKSRQKWLYCWGLFFLSDLFKHAQWTNQSCYYAIRIKTGTNIDLANVRHPSLGTCCKCLRLNRLFQALGQWSTRGKRAIPQSPSFFRLFASLRHLSSSSQQTERAWKRLSSEFWLVAYVNVYVCCDRSSCIAK